MNNKVIESLSYSFLYPLLVYFLSGHIRGFITFKEIIRLKNDDLYILIYNICIISFFPFINESILIILLIITPTIIQSFNNVNVNNFLKITNLMLIMMLIIDYKSNINSSIYFLAIFLSLYSLLLRFEKEKVLGVSSKKLLRSSIHLSTIFMYLIYVTYNKHIKEIYLIILFLTFLVLNKLFDSYLLISEKKKLVILFTLYIIYRVIL